MKPQDPGRYVMLMVHLSKPGLETLYTTRSHPCCAGLCPSQLNLLIVGLDLEESQVLNISIRTSPSQLPTKFSSQASTGKWFVAEGGQRPTELWVP